MDAQALESEAKSAIASASTLEELEDLRVRYLGRKSALKLALREVRDRETGMALNAAREAIEDAFRARSSQLERESIDRRLSEEIVDITLPGEAIPRGNYHLITQIRREVEDVFLGLGYRIVDGDEVEDTWP
ncbi:MAG: phenylalanine--tRNA ligase subunit alpha, partial [Gaiellaceae bacterium]